VSIQVAVWIDGIFLFGPTWVIRIYYYLALYLFYHNERKQYNFHKDTWSEPLSEFLECASLHFLIRNVAAPSNNHVRTPTSV
jgi:hypothetical protein